MKNEKLCFSKQTGLIALVGVVIVGMVGLVIAMTSLPSTSTSTRATSCEDGFCADGTLYNDCSQNSWGINNGFKCVCEGKSSYPVLRKHNDCLPPAAKCTGTCFGSDGHAYSNNTCAPEGGKKCKCVGNNSYPTWNNDDTCGASTSIAACNKKTCAGGVKPGDCAMSGYSSGKKTKKMCACAVGASYPTFWDPIDNECP